MAAVAFDTLKMVDRLQAGGFSADQARAASTAFAEAMSGAELATKPDLLAVEARLQHEIVVVRAEARAAEQRLEARIDAAEQRLEAKIDAVEQRLEAKIDTLEQKIETSAAAVKADVLRWMFAALATQTALIAGLMVGLVKLVG